MQVHSGYDVWADDLRAPNFTSCDLKTCHPKSVVRPMGVDVMNVHHFHRAAPGAGWPFSHRSGRRSVPFMWLCKTTTFFLSSCIASVDSGESCMACHVRAAQIR